MEDHRQHHIQGNKSDEPGTAKDPVCGMTIAPQSARDHSLYQGTSYYFCSLSCKTKFDESPVQYLTAPEARSAALAQEGMEYTCPMHPQIRQNGPGKCPFCGMALEPVAATLEEEDDSEYKMMLKRFWVSAALSIPLLFVTLGGRHLIHNEGLLAQLKWAEVLLASPVVLWGGWPFFERFWLSLRNRSLNMFTLIGLGVAVAYGYSLVAILFPGLFPASFRDTMTDEAGLYFEAAAVIVTLVLLGQVLELKARGQTSAAIKALLGLQPKTARRIAADGKEEDIPLEQVHVSDQLRVRPGEKIPVD